MSKGEVLFFDSIEDYAQQTSDILEYMNENNLKVNAEIEDQDGKIILVLH